MADTKTDFLPPAIRESGLPVIKSGEQLHALVHSVFTPDKFNILVPKALTFSPGIKVAIQMVELDSKINPTTKRSKDYWGIGKNPDEFNLSSNAIRKIAGAVNAEWVSKECGVESEAYDEKGQVLRLRYKAVVRVRTSLGNVKTGIGTYEYNYNQDLDDARFKEYTWDDRNKKKNYTGDLKWDQINQRRQFALQLAESGAKSRAIYDALGILEKSYAKEDLAKPFIIPCAVPDIDYTDPAFKKMAAEQSLGITREVFGPDAIPGPIDASYEVLNGQKVDKATGEVSQPQAAAPEAPTEIPTVPEPPKAEPSAKDQRDAYEREWRGASSAERGEKINKLIDKLNLRKKFTDEAKEKNYKPVGEWNIELQIKWIMAYGTAAGEIPKEAADGKA